MNLMLISPVRFGIPGKIELKNNKYIILTNYNPNNPLEVCYFYYDVDKSSINIFQDEDYNSHFKKLVTHIEY